MSNETGPEKLVILLEKEVFNLQLEGGRKILAKYGVRVPDHQLEKAMDILFSEMRQKIEAWRRTHLEKFEGEAEQWAAINRVKGKRSKEKKESEPKQELEVIDDTELLGKE